MSAIDTAGTLSASAGGATGVSALNSDEFTRIILTELSNQDPLEPNDTNALLDQLATIQSIESDTQLSNTLESFSRTNEFTVAAGLIGKVIEGRSTQGGDVLDVAISVTQTSDNVLVNLAGGSQIEIENVREVFDPAALGPAEEPADDTDDETDQQDDTP